MLFAARGMTGADLVDEPRNHKRQTNLIKCISGLGRISILELHQLTDDAGVR